MPSTWPPITSTRAGLAPLYGTSVTLMPAELATMAERLQIKPGAAALQIVRHYLDADGQTIEITVTTHPADRFSLTMRLQRANARAGA